VAFAGLGTPIACIAFLSRTVDRVAKETRIMSREGNLLWSIGLAMALTGVAAITAVVDQKPQPATTMATIAAPIPAAQHQKTAALGNEE
jgi:hypothetical protein